LKQRVARFVNGILPLPVLQMEPPQGPPEIREVPEQSRLY
jgi:hypothetical protein